MKGRALPPLLQAAVAAVLMLAATRLYVVLGPPGEWHAASIQVANLCRAAALLLAQLHLHGRAYARVRTGGPPEPNRVLVTATAFLMPLLLMPERTINAYALATLAAVAISLHLSAVHHRNRQARRLRRWLDAGQDRVQP